MNIFDNVILNVILILFPILLYFVYNCYTSVKNLKPNKDVFYFLLITSLYLCLKFGKIENIYILLLFANIPILIAYLKNEKKFAIILSLFIICYSYFTFDINMFYVFIQYICYFIIYTICRKKKININDFILIISIIQSFFLSFFVFLTIEGTFKLLMDIFWLVIVFFLTTIFILYLFDVLDNLSNLFITIKDLEKDKQIKNSLFKLTHEIKNPLAVCKGYLQMINLENQEKTEKYLNIIKSEIERSLLIMADFSEFNKIKLNKEITDINLLIQEVTNNLNLLATDQNIKIKFTNNTEIYINIDYNKIKQVIINIIKNSIEAINTKGTITIKTSKKLNNCYIEITDNGQGMDEYTLEKLTEMFYTTKKNGTGLGVALSNEIIKAHNGTMDYTSKVNQGTTVTIKLPMK